MVALSDQAALQSWLDAVPMPALLIATTQEILGVNPQAVRLIGPNLVGRHFITALRQPDVLDAIEAVLRDRTPRQARFLDHDDDIDLTYRVNCAFVDMGAVQGVLVCFEDRTYLERAAQTRRDFVANVSHELRTPLTAMIGFIETLRGPARDDASARERFLGIMHAEAARMERLVQDLLSLSWVETQERQRPTDRIEIGKTLASTVHMLANLATESGVDLRLEQTDHGLVLGDADQLRQVFTNLIENAIKYGGQGKTVRVQMSVSDYEMSVRAPAVIVAITDAGPGIDRIHIPRLTERFYRADTHRSRAMGGTGLGLAIVKHILNRHRGRLKINSALGQGSCFRVILPRIASQ